MCFAYVAYGIYSTHVHINWLILFQILGSYSTVKLLKEAAIQASSISNDINCLDISTGHYMSTNSRMVSCYVAMLYMCNLLLRGYCCVFISDDFSQCHDLIRFLSIYKTTERKRKIRFYTKIDSLVENSGWRLKLVNINQLKLGNLRRFRLSQAVLFSQELII